MRTLLMETIMTPSTFWSAVSAIATLFAALGIFLAARQLRFSAWIKAQEIFTAEPFVAARKLVFSHLATPTEQWPDAHQENALLLCRRMDELCHLAPYLGRRRIIEWWASPLAKSWAAVAWLVERERAQSRDPGKWRAFQQLAEKSLAGLPASLRAELSRARDESVAALRPLPPPTAASGGARPTSA